MNLRLDGFAVQDGEDPSAHDLLVRDGGQAQFFFVKEFERILDGVSVSASNRWEVIWSDQTLARWKRRTEGTVLPPRASPWVARAVAGTTCPTTNTTTKSALDHVVTRQFICLPL